MRRAVWGKTACIPCMAFSAKRNLYPNQGVNRWIAVEGQGRQTYLVYLNRSRCRSLVLAMIAREEGPVASFHQPRLLSRRTVSYSVDVVSRSNNLQHVARFARVLQLFCPARKRPMTTRISMGRYAIPCGEQRSASSRGSLSRHLRMTAGDSNG